MPQVHLELMRTRLGSLPVLLVVLTITTGLIDAVSVLGLGRVFTANMTGNIVFLGFAVAGVPLGDCWCCEVDLDSRWC